MESTRGLKIILLGKHFFCFYLNIHNFSSAIYSRLFAFCKHKSFLNPFSFFHRKKDVKLQEMKRNGGFIKSEGENV